MRSRPLWTFDVLMLPIADFACCMFIALLLQHGEQRRTCRLRSVRHSIVWGPPPAAAGTWLTWSYPQPAAGSRTVWSTGMAASPIPSTDTCPMLRRARDGCAGVWAAALMSAVATCHVRWLNQAKTFRGAQHDMCWCNQFCVWQVIALHYPSGAHATACPVCAHCSGFLRIVRSRVLMMLSVGQAAREGLLPWEG